MSRFHQYSFGNCLLILQQRPNATQVAGFTAWKKLGRTVKKGEKGICILAPLLVVRQESNEGEEVKILEFRSVHVFDIAQSDGKDPLAFKAIMSLPQPTAFTALVHGFDGECPCCRRRFRQA